MNKFLAVTLALAAVVSTCSADNVCDISIVPNPVSIKAAGSGAAYLSVPTFDANSEDLVELASIFAQNVDGRPLPEIMLRTDEKLGKEEYVLDSRKGKVCITGGSKEGVWWGLQTVTEILGQSGGSMFPGLVIKDKPEFAMRSAHFDCCRHFFTVEEVKEFIDEISLHKLNTLHWHLTDDQGWRAEIKKYPLLTEVGSIREEKDGTLYGGYYTQEEMKEVVAYAAARCVTVIPEIEMPGHASAALAAYPELGCSGEGYQVRNGWGVFPEIFCAGNPKVLEFLKDVMDEICAIFPSDYIHIGGDEAPRDEWKKCDKCQALMAEMGYESEAQLQSYLIDEIERYLESKGRKIIGWDEILEGGISQSATVMSWRGAEGGIAAAKMGNDVILVPTSHFYLDYHQTADPEANKEPSGIGGYISLRKCYSFDPYEGLSTDEKKHVLGIQGNIWTEYILTFDHVQKMVLPRHAALAEVAWSGRNRTTYEEFVERVRTALLPVYQERGYSWSDYAFRYPPVE